MVCMMDYIPVLGRDEEQDRRFAKTLGRLEALSEMTLNKEKCEFV